jgi:murein L,D-transpeptidase YcbB/YkuD
MILLFSLSNESCKRKGKRNKDADIRLHGSINQHSNLPFDSAQVAPFFTTYPELKRYETDVLAIYRQYKFNHIWFDKKGIVEFGNSLYSKVNDIDEEGISTSFPYKGKIDFIFNDESAGTLNAVETELMLTNLYLYYAHKVYKGLDDTTSEAMGWLLPRKQVSYARLLDSIMTEEQLPNEEGKVLFGQYYKLREVLKRYREMEKKGGWKPIDLDAGLKSYKPGDTANAIRQIRERLFVSGDLKQNTGSNGYDPDLVAAVNRFQLHNGFKSDSLILPRHIREMNVPIAEIIKKIVVNMERCRWISPEIYNAKTFIVVNIPSYNLSLLREGKTEFESPVVVGASMTKTVIFGGKMSYLVFSPYWNLPKSIIEKEVKPGMAKNKNYLESHNMEWNNGQVRQKPGKNNSLGLVKFIFPNSNDIYFHDTPAKSLFKKENRAFSHGCVRVARARDLAITILKDDSTWTTKKIDAAMKAGKERICPLKNKIPVYIGYFTAWVDEQGEANFYKDVYERDESLAKLLIDN